jgi:two-component system chemotaxis response regulator CheB
MTVVGSLPQKLPAAFFVVLHIPAESPSLLPDILSRAGPLEAVQAVDGMDIEHGCIYVAPPDHHLLMERGLVRVVRGPKENRHRPAVDPLFRSAARAYGPRVVGVVLTGALDDGTAGLLTVKKRGGIAVVQEPDEALYPSMPLSALANVEVDYRLPLSSIGSLLVRLASEPVEEIGEHPVSKDMELKLAEMDLDTLYHDERNGKPSAFSCPECGGVLWELGDGDLLRFRCRVGHAFSVESIQAEQSETLEKALWGALKTLEESASLSRRLAGRAHAHGHELAAKRYEVKVQEAENHATVIRQLILRGEAVVLPESIADPANNTSKDPTPET